MAPRLVMIGGGAHLPVVLEVARYRGIDVRGVLDAGKPIGSVVHGLQVLGGDERISSLIAPDTVFHVSVTTPYIRRRLRELVAGAEGRLATLIHPAAMISGSARIGDGCFIGVGAIVGVDALLDHNVILNTGAQVDHNCRVGSDCHIAPRAVLTGGIRCGTGTFIGAGAVIGPSTHIGERCVIGAGSTVLDDIADDSRVFGLVTRRP